jgi:hypothetical protein
VTFALSRPLSDAPHEANACEKCYEYAACTAGMESRRSSAVCMQAEDNDGFNSAKPFSGRDIAGTAEDDLVGAGGWSGGFSSLFDHPA